MSESERSLTPPPVNLETEAFWQAAGRGELVLKRCKACAKTHYYPRAICPFCQSSETEWYTASGQGTIYSYSVMRRAAIPYVIAYVTLAEGITMMTNIVDCDADALAIGQPVSVTFKPAENGQAIPMFTPA